MCVLLKGTLSSGPLPMLGPQRSSEETPTAVPLPEVPPGDVLSGHLRLPQPVLPFPEAPRGCD